jgi:carboxymethylenebutenolidase
VPSSEELIEISAAGGRMPASVCVPEGDGPFPGLLVIMEADGLTRHVRAVGRRLADEGYLTLAPDLYYRQKTRTVANDDADRARDMVMRTIALSDAPEERVKDDRVVGDLVASLEQLKAHPKLAVGRLGTVGFGMGGRLALLLACRCPDALRVSVSFYGGHVVPVVEETQGLRTPILLFFGAADRSIPLYEVDRIRAELLYREKLHEIVTFEAAGHGFFCDERSSYHPEAARAGWLRMLEWLAKYLA